MRIKEIIRPPTEADPFNQWWRAGYKTSYKGRQMGIVYAFKEKPTKEQLKRIRLELLDGARRTAKRLHL